MRVQIKISELDQTQANAIAHVKKAIDCDKLFPEDVFSGTWHAFRFFESDRVFDVEFVEVVRKLLAAESSHLASLVNLDKTDDSRKDTIDAAFISSSTSSETYADALRMGGPEDGWLFDVDRYAFSSDLGNWCIYCEKSNDIAVIALRTPTHLVEFERAIRILDAKPISDLLHGVPHDRFPFNRLVGAWREGLIKWYS